MCWNSPRTIFCQVVSLLYRNNNSHLLIDVINEGRASSLPSLPPKLNLTAILCLGRENKWASYSIHGEQVKIFQWLFLWSVYFKRFEGEYVTRWISILLESKNQEFQPSACLSNVNTDIVPQSSWAFSQFHVLCNHPISECHSYLYKKQYSSVQVSRKIQWKRFPTSL